MFAIRNKCIATSNKCLTSSNKKLVETSTGMVDSDQTSFGDAFESGRSSPCCRHFDGHLWGVRTGRMEALFNRQGLHHFFGSEFNGRSEGLQAMSEHAKPNNCNYKTGSWKEKATLRIFAETNCEQQRHGG